MDERELLLLGLLWRQEMHGYELSHFLEHRLGAVLTLNRSTAYFLLDRLAQRSLVEAEVEREGRRPERRVYRLTIAGKEAFQAALREHLRRHSPPQYPDEVGLLFLEMVPLAERRTLLQEKLDAVEQHLRWAQERQASHADTPARWLMSHQLAHLEAEARWLRETLAKPEALSNQSSMEVQLETRMATSK